MKVSRNKTECREQSSSIKDEIIKLCFQTNYSLDIQGGGGGEWVWMPPPHKVFLSFFPEDKTSAPEVFGSCSFISRTDFETGLVIVSCFVYGI